MIQGLVLQFTSEELQQHCISVATWWAKMAEMADHIIEMKGRTYGAELTTKARAARSSYILKCGFWKEAAGRIPQNEVFHFKLGELESIQYPIIEATEEQIEKALFFDTVAELKRLYGQLDAPPTGTKSGWGSLS